MLCYVNAAAAIAPTLIRHWVIRAPHKTRFVGPARVWLSNGISAVMEAHAADSDQHTDKTTPLLPVAIARMHAACSAG